MSENQQISMGTPLPLGAHAHNGGVNFAVFSRHARRLWLLLFAEPAETQPCQCLELDPEHHRTGDIWHIYVKGAKPGMAYVYHADGLFAPERGHRFDRHRTLLDPYATALTGTEYWDFAQISGQEPGVVHLYRDTIVQDSEQYRVKCLILKDDFDWEGDLPLKHPWSDFIIYETHVRGLTLHPSAQVLNPGGFLGVIEKIPYFKRLGITAIEFMPLQQFNPYELPRANPFTGEPLVNYWGYDTIAFFAPHEGYGSRRYPGCQVTEFKTLVKELHKAGIEVLLDVVFNHTGEGNEKGPTLNFRGLDNSIYYLLETEKDAFHYKNYSGCGNTMNCNHPVVRSYILDCLRYWVIEMHVDGFRFDLASILGRDQSGHLLPNPPLLEHIAEDPILREVKIIAEAWDAGGAYQVGSFPGKRWSEWNGRFRDEVRRFWRADHHMAGALATRLCGSSDLYEHSGKAPINSINFITCHDGFTLYDLVSYQNKHNEANGEHNRDGGNENFSCNYGIEGPTDEPFIHQMRLRQIKNMLATLFLSRGIPMLLGGDEFGRTQQGNNNAYCQDNELSWYDWSLLQKNEEIFRFTQGVIAFRKMHPVLTLEQFYQPNEIDWFGPQGNPPDWQDTQTLGGHLYVDPETGQDLCFLFNAGPEATSLYLPHPPAGKLWCEAINTGAPPPKDICRPGDESPLIGINALPLADRSFVVLVAKDQT